MPPIALLHLMSAAFIAGIGSTVAVLSLFMRAADGKHRSASCFVRITIAVCFGLSIYMVIEGWLLAG